MKRKGRGGVIIVLAILTFLAVILTNVYFQQRREAILRLQQKQKIKKSRVLIASKEILKGTIVTEEMLALRMLPTEFLQPGALNSQEAVVGKVAEATIMQGEQVLSTKLAAQRRDLTLAAQPPLGKRAFTIDLEDAATVGGIIQAKDRVDILAIFASPAYTVTLFQDVLVMAVGEKVTLALTPQEVQILTVAMQHGEIRLVLRPPGEVSKSLPAVDLNNLPAAIDFNTLLQYYIKPLPSQEEKPGATPAPAVEIIRGLKKEEVLLPVK